MNMIEAFKLMIGLMAAITLWILLVIGVAFLIGIGIEKIKDMKEALHARKMNRGFKKVLEEEE